MLDVAFTIYAYADHIDVNWRGSTVANTMRGFVTQLKMWKRAEQVRQRCSLRRMWGKKLTIVLFRLKDVRY